MGIQACESWRGTGGTQWHPHLLIKDEIIGKYLPPSMHFYE